MNKNQKIQKRTRRHARIRAKVKGISSRPRLSVFKSNKYLYAQAINDDEKSTLCGISDKTMKGKTKTDRAREAGKKIAKLLKEKKISHVVFDRGGFIYTGRIRALAEGAREGGLIF